MDTNRRALLLRNALEDINTPKDTPARIARWLDAYATTITLEGAQAVLGTPFEANGHDGIVIVKGIQFTALCEHHLLPFSGYASVGYLPDTTLVGLSKLARLVEYCTRVPTLQENITSSVAKNLQHKVEPKGVMVTLYDVMHSCMSMRGIRDKHATTTTSVVLGLFRESAALRNEFLQLMR